MIRARIKFDGDLYWLWIVDWRVGAMSLAELCLVRADGVVWPRWEPARRVDVAGPWPYRVAVWVLDELLAGHVDEPAPEIRGQHHIDPALARSAWGAYLTDPLRYQAAARAIASSTAASFRDKLQAFWPEGVIS